MDHDTDSHNSVRNERESARVSIQDESTQDDNIGSSVANGSSVVRDESVVVDRSVVFDDDVIGPDDKIVSDNDDNNSIQIYNNESIVRDDDADRRNNNNENMLGTQESSSILDDENRDTFRDVTVVVPTGHGHERRILLMVLKSMISSSYDDYPITTIHDNANNNNNGQTPYYYNSSSSGRTRSNNNDGMVAFLSQHEEYTLANTTTHHTVATASMGAVFELIETKQDLFKPNIKKAMKQLIAEEFADETYPTLFNLINVGRLYPNRPRFQPGEYVEILGKDMKYKIDMVTRVVKWRKRKRRKMPLSKNNKDDDSSSSSSSDSSNDGDEWEFFYHCDAQRKIPSFRLRSPKEGLLCIFGNRPFVWQQWACLKLEHHLRFQMGHQEDFQSFDMVQYATQLWDLWLLHPDNADFQRLLNDDRIGDRGRSELVNHILSPFHLMRRMATHDEDDWDFENETRFSVFTYLGLLGTGYIVPVIIVILQMAVPGILVWNLIEGGFGGSCQNFNFFGYSSKCTVSPVAQAMGLVILLYYLWKVVPDSCFDFYETAGTSTSIYSRLISLRRNIWMRGEDRMDQLLGFRMDVYMNTAYVAFLYMLNIFIIINTDDAFEILLNALAFEFVINLDREFVLTPWWDYKRRWITAGSVELVLQSTLCKHALENGNLFCETFGIPKEVLGRLDTSSPLFIKNRLQALSDRDDLQFMTPSEAVKHVCQSVARELNNRHAINEYQKQQVFFGSGARCINWFVRAQRGGVFDRYSDYRTWSMWEVLLYAAPIPNLDDILCKGSHGETTVNVELKSITSTTESPFANLDLFFLTPLGKHDWLTFLKYYLQVLSFHFTWTLVQCRWKQERYSSILFVVIDGILHWIAFAVQLIFPIFTLLCCVGLVASIICRNANLNCVSI